jgi:ABC-type Fe3+-siderophore transport system permease subunit
LAELGFRFDGREKSMKKWLLGLLLGGALGVFDGLSAWVSTPEVRDQIMGIVIGSTIKGFIAGILIGFFSHKIRNMTAGIVVGVLISGFFAALVLFMQYKTDGSLYVWQIMLPGCVVGIIVGYATQKFGTGAVISS